MSGCRRQNRAETGWQQIAGAEREQQQTESAGAEPLLRVEGAAVAYGSRQVIRDASFCLHAGEFCALLGLNGSGKTTLLRAIAGLKRLGAGRVRVNGTDVTSLNEYRRARYLSYIPQRHSTIYNTSVLDVALMGFNAHLPLLSQPTQRMREQAVDTLERLGLPDRSGEDFLTLSEGQKQLVILARAILQDAPVMLMDEPDSALDFVNRHQVLMRVREQLAGARCAGLITLHDPTFALAYCDRILLLQDGVIADEIRLGTASREQIGASLSRIYGPVDVLPCPQGFVMVRA